jgi:hypothetical protein
MAIVVAAKNIRSIRDVFSAIDFYWGIKNKNNFAIKIK